MKSNLCVRNWLYSPLFHKDQERREIEVTTDCFLSIVVSTWPLFFLDNSVLSQMVSDSRFVIYLTRPHSVPDRSLQSTPPDSSFIENCDISAPWTFVGFINDCRHSMTTMRKSVKGVINHVLHIWGQVIEHTTFLQYIPAYSFLDFFHTHNDEKIL